MLAARRHGRRVLAVTLAAVAASPGGACESGSVCDGAECVPHTDAGATNGGACTLSLIAAGPLADPLTQGGTLLGTPALAATPGGFLAGYRELDPTTGEARLTTIAIDSGGAAAPPVRTSLHVACPTDPTPAGIGLAFSGMSGTLAVARPACGSDAGPTAGGIDLFAIDVGGRVQTTAFSGQTGLSIALARSHALAYTPAGLLLAYTNESTQASFAAGVTGVQLPVDSRAAAVLGLQRVDGRNVSVRRRHSLRDRVPRPGHARTRWRAARGRARRSCH